MISSGMPRVNISEINQTTRVPSFPGVYGYIQLDSAPIGPVGSLQLVTSEADLLAYFTVNNKVEVGYSSAYWSALAFLNYSNTLWVQRIVSGSKWGGVEVKRESSSGSNIPISPAIGDPTAFSFVSDDSFILVGKSPGVWCGLNPGLAVRLYSYDENPTVVQTPNAFGIEVYKRNNLNDPVEQMWTCSKTPGAKDGYGRNIYIEDVLLQSGYISGVDNVAVTDTYPNVLNGGLWTVEIPTLGSGSSYNLNDVLALTGGDSNGTVQVAGIDVLGSVTSVRIVTPGNRFVVGTTYNTTVSSHAGTSSGSGCRIKVDAVGLFFSQGTDGGVVSDGEMISGLTLIANKSDKPVTVLMDGGWTPQPYASALWGLAETRKDCIATLSTDYAAEASASYINALLTYRNSTLNANTSFAALYSPHPYIYDRYNDRSLYVPPDGYAAAQISFTGAQYELWFPPAGNKRGVLNVNDVRRRFSEGEMSVLFNAQINPFRYVPGKGIRIWGDSTLTSIPSSLQAINVRLLLIVIEPAIAEALESFIFDLNTTDTRRQAKGMIDAYMNNIKSRAGVYAFQTVSDASNNSNADIANFRLNIDLAVSPTLPIRYINFRVIVTPPNDTTIVPV